MIIASLLSLIAHQQVSVARDLMWGRAGSWTVSRAAGATCVARDGDMELTPAGSGGAVLTLRNLPWAGRRDITTITISSDDTADPDEKVVVTVPVRRVREGGGAPALVVRLSATQVTRLNDGAWDGFEIRAGRTTEGEVLGRQDLGDVADAVLLLEGCTRGLLAERAARPHRGQVSILLGPTDLITTADYPAAALRGEQQGRVVVLLDFAADGYPDRCEIEQSSGYSALDNQTCRVLRWRYRIAPPLDENGAPRRALLRQGVTWALPDD